jgi:hypothetical protein
LTCDKVWGPKKNNALRYIQSNFEESLPAHVSIIVDSNLSDKDLLNLRYLHRNVWNVEVTADIEAEVLQNLFCEYGFTLSDKTLLYAALTYSRNHWPFPLAPLDGESDILYWEYVSLFQKNLLSAIRTELISECHLFAIFLVLQSRSIHERDFEIAHKQGFASILRKLVSESRKPGQRFNKLSFLWQIVLSYLRNRELYRLQVSEPRPLVLELHEVAYEGPVRALFREVSHFGRTLPGTYRGLISKHPRWWSLVQTLYEDRACLRTCLARLVCKRPEE